MFALGAPQDDPFAKAVGTRVTYLKDAEGSGA
jgi:hypothetical protein